MQGTRNAVRYLCGHSAVVKRFRPSFSQLYRHPKVGTGPVDIRTARSKAAFLGRPPFNAVPARSTAQVGILVLPPCSSLLLYIFYLYPISIHCYCIFLYLYSISVHFYCMFFVSILYSIICIQYLFISIVYVSFLFYIRSFVFNN